MEKERKEGFSVFDDSMARKMREKLTLAGAKLKPMDE